MSEWEDEFFDGILDWFENKYELVDADGVKTEEGYKVTIEVKKIPVSESLARAAKRSRECQVPEACCCAHRECDCGGDYRRPNRRQDAGND